MTKFRSVLLPFTFLLAACQLEADPHTESSKDAIQTRMPVSPFRNPVAMSDSSQRAVSTSLPDPGEVLLAIYKKEGDGSSSYEVGNQVWVSYWYGHAYEIDGRRYFTGFAYNTGTPSEDGAGISAPGDQVEISQATYAIAPEGSVTVWEFAGAERDIGKFGGRERGNAIDEEASPQTFRTAGGDYLLAVPTWYLETGVKAKTAELFMLKRQQMHWQYLGSIATGEDNSAGCASDDVAEGLPPCAVNTGLLEFQPQQESEMPFIRVEMKGKVIDGPGKTRDFGPRGTAEYRYDQATSMYMLVQR